MYETVDRAVGRLSRLLALGGGAVLLVLTVLTCLSIAGRELASQGFDAVGQIAGDFEMMELGMAVAIFAFLPWTQYTAAHARVDLFAPLVRAALCPPGSTFSRRSSWRGRRP